MTQDEAIEIYVIHFERDREEMFICCYPDNKQFKEFLRSKTRKYWQEGEADEDGTIYKVFMPEGMTKDKFRQQLHELSPEKPVYEMIHGN